MVIDEVIEFLGKDWDRMEAMLGEYLFSDVALLNDTNASILSRGGKKLRPMLALLVARACSGGTQIPDSSINFAVAAELLHNATLLHDDVADGSTLRRGAPTVYSRMGPAASVLIGDFWLVQAAQCVINAEHSKDKLIPLMTKTLRNLAEGEMLQLQKAESADTSVDDYMRIIYSKTASLFETACVSAALSVNADDRIVAAVKEYAICLGLAFQIRDDILDYSGDAALGKPVGIDLREKKITLPLLGALMEVDDESNRLVRSMVADMDSKPENEGKIREFVSVRGGMEYARARLGEFVDKAVNSIRVLPESKEKQYLIELAKFTADRVV